jgi:hypothetical protein
MSAFTNVVIVILIIVIVVLVLLLTGIIGKKAVPTCAQANYLSIPNANGAGFTCVADGFELKRLPAGINCTGPLQATFANPLCACSLACKATDSCSGTSKVTEFSETPDFPLCPGSCTSTTVTNDPDCTCFDLCQSNFDCSGIDKQTTFTGGGAFPNCPTNCLTTTITSKADPLCTCQIQCAVAQSCSGNTAVTIFSIDSGHPNCPVGNAAGDCQPVSVFNDPTCICDSECIFTGTDVCSEIQDGVELAIATNAPGQTCSASCMTNPTIANPNCHVPVCDPRCNWPVETFVFDGESPDSGHCILGSGCNTGPSSLPWTVTIDEKNPIPVYITTVAKGSLSTPLVIGLNLTNLAVEFTEIGDSNHQTQWIIDGVNMTIHPFGGTYPTECLTGIVAGATPANPLEVDAFDASPFQSWIYTNGVLNIGGSAYTSVLSTQAPNFNFANVYLTSDVGTSNSIYQAGVTDAWYSITVTDPSIL